MKKKTKRLKIDNRGVKMHKGFKRWRRLGLRLRENIRRIIDEV